MKKLIIIFASLFFSLVTAQSIKYGVTGSIHNGSIAGVHGISKPNFGGSLGVFADFSLVPNDIYDSAWLYFTPQLEVYNIGEKGDWNEDKVDYQKYMNVYVAAPLYIKYYIKSHGYKTDIFFMLGPKLEYFVSENTNEGTAVKDAKAAGFDPNKFGLGQRIDSFGYGVSVKAGFKVGEKMEAFIRFDRGLSKIYPDYTAQNTFNQFLALGLSFYIGETW